MSLVRILVGFLVYLTSFSFSVLPAGADESLTAYQVLQGYDLPVGLLPEGVKSYELDTSTGKFTVYLDKTCSFWIQDYKLKYKTKITGVITKHKLRNLKGVSVRVLLLWLNIVEVTREDSEIDFSVGIASADFPLDGFEESPRCGCGFDCNGKLGAKNTTTAMFNRFMSSS